MFRFLTVIAMMALVGNTQAIRVNLNQISSQSTDLKLVSSILKVVKKDDDGKITKIALVTAMEDLAALVDY